MKKVLVRLFAITAAVIMSVCVLSSCTAVQNNKAEESVDVAAEESRVKELCDAFKAPAEAGIKLEKASPEYDEQGRLISCVYKIDKTEFSLGYTYTDDGIDIFAFAHDGTVVEASHFKTEGGFDKSIGEKTANGYYFVGFNVIENSVETEKETEADTEKAEDSEAEEKSADTKNGESEETENTSDADESEKSEETN